MAMRNALYLAVNPEVAADYVSASDNYDGEDIIVFAVDMENLDQRKVGYDWNNRCEHASDINSIAYFGNIPPSFLSIADDTDEDQNIEDFRGCEAYERIMSVFEEEVETNLENS